MPIDRSTTESPRAETEQTEARMRQALGLREGGSGEQHPQQRADQARSKHRFARDGEVPVVVLNTRREQEGGSSPRNRLDALEASLQGERAARAAAERGLAEAVASVQSLRTKLAHAELAHREALAAAAAAREQLEHALQEALAPKAVVVDEVKVREEPKVREPKIEAPKIEASKIEASRRAAAKPPGKAAGGARMRQAKPVKWWLPGYSRKA